VQSLAHKQSVWIESSLKLQSAERTLLRDPNVNHFSAARSENAKHVQLRGRVLPSFLLELPPSCMLWIVDKNVILSFGNAICMLTFSCPVWPARVR
jgi:hypothetical protein